MIQLIQDSRRKMVLPQQSQEEERLEKKLSYSVCTVSVIEVLEHVNPQELEAGNPFNHHPVNVNK